MSEEERIEFVASNKSKVPEQESSSSSEDNVEDVDLSSLLLEDTK